MVTTSTRGRGFASDFFKEGWALILFLRHYDDAPTLLKPQPQIRAMDADDEQLRRHLKLNKLPSPNLSGVVRLELHLKLSRDDARGPWDDVVASSARSAVHGVTLVKHVLDREIKPIFLVGCVDAYPCIDERVAF